MKRICMLLCCFIAASSAYSQVRLGVKGGMNLSNQRNVTEGTRINNSGNLEKIAGFQVGLISDIKLAKALHLRPELQFITKGSKVTGTGANIKSKPQYIELPVNLVYYHQAPKISFFAGAGPAFAYGVGGSYRFNGTKSDIFGGESSYKRFDLGVNIVAGIDLPGGFTAALNFNKGLTKAWGNNVTLTDFEGTELEKINVYGRNISYGISVGYFFHRKK